jgi:hypothetical protein
MRAGVEAMMAGPTLLRRSQFHGALVAAQNFSVRSFFLIVTIS